MLRAVQLIHRYLGIAGCVLMLLWCASGFVMMYVAYPSVSEDRRLSGLQALDLSAARVDLIPPVGASTGPFSIERLDGQPILRATDQRAVSVISLTTGQPMTSVSAARASRVAREFLGASGRTAPELLGVVTRDQWTVSGQFNGERPFYVFDLGDAQRTRVYVSSVTGRVVQAVSRSQRFWNWLGAIPHWLYLVELRQRPTLWRQVVIAAGLVGCFLTASGLYLGVQRLPWRGSGSSLGGNSLLRWHHASGFFFGTFALTWALSGLLSVQPWGFLESRGSLSPATLAVQPTAAQLVTALRSFAPLDGSFAPLDGSFVSLRSAPLGSDLFFIASTRSGRRERFDRAGRRAPLAAADVAALGVRLGSHEPVIRLDREDDYLFSHHDEHVTLPAYRISLPDGSDLYLDATTGFAEGRFDANARVQRWLDGMHRFDLLPVLRVRPLWDVLVLCALAGVSVISFTGARLAYRRLFVGDT
jgi:uncharacterized iron-regulated membrane protein